MEKLKILGVPRIVIISVYRRKEREFDADQESFLRIRSGKNLEPRFSQPV